MKTKKTNNKPLVVIFGRTNVGKSTLFNCLTEKHQALVSSIAGTTRDTNEGQVSWRGLDFTLFDTGGIMDLKVFGRPPRKGKTGDDIDAKIQQQARDYLVRADLILFLADARDGLLPQDRQISREMKKILKKKDHVVLVANKVDKPALRRELSEFNKLGLGEPVPVSATTGSGTGDLLDIVVDKLGTVPEAPADFGPDQTSAADGANDEIAIAVIGRPNVGKSSLVNNLLKENRLIVSATPHTTREPQDIVVTFEGRRYRFIDTAGVSKRGHKAAKPTRKSDSLEKQSITRSLETINRADIALLVFDVTVPLEHQESKLVDEIVKTRTSLLLLANKWDLAEDRDTKRYTEYIYDHLPFVRWAPIQFVSALTGEKTAKIFPLIERIAAERKIKIENSSLTRFLGKIVKMHRPAKGKGTKHPRIYELSQSRVNPPRFTVRIGARDNLHFSYVRFIENRLREKYGFLGTPISIYVSKNPRVHGQHAETAGTKKSTNDA